MNVMNEIFNVRVPVISVVHLTPLPGSPRYENAPVAKIVEKALEDATLLAESGVDGLIIENFGDVMFSKKVGPEIVAAMTVVAKKIKETVSIPIGLCVLQNDVVAGLAIAKAVGADFIRAGYYTEVSIADSGMMESVAAEALRYRRYIDCEAKIFADVQVKHSYPLMQRPIEEAAEDACERGLADAVVITGKKTGGEANPDEVIRVKKALPDVPIMVGSGVTVDNVERYFNYIDAIIISSGLNLDGDISKGLDRARAVAFTNKIEELRKDTRYAK